VTTELTGAPPLNWSRLLDQTKREYETPPARGIAHAVQKEAIQNGWGARDGKKKWTFAFQLHLPTATGNPRFLTLTDTGTVGLVGDMGFDTTKLAKDEPIPESQRLARFEAMFESGATAFGPGLFGRGKLVFNAASEQSMIFFDTLTKDGTYRFGVRHVDGRECRQATFEGAAATGELAARSSGLLQPLATVGTRITIVDPIAEVVDALNDNTFLQAVEETWWEIIQKYQAHISIQIPAAKLEVAQVPKDFGGLPESPSKGWKVSRREMLQVPVEGQKYRVKRLHMLVPPPKHQVRPELLGLQIHRRGMVVGQMRLSGMPAEISERFFGYVALDNELEDAMAEQENITHYGFAYQQRSPYRQLRTLLQTEFDKFLEELGLKKADTSPEEKDRRLIEDAQADLNSILNSLGVPGFGAGKAAGPNLQLSVEELEFPDGSNQVKDGDRIEDFHFKLSNRGRQPSDVSLTVRTFDRETGTIETLYEMQGVSVKPEGHVLTESLVIDVRTPPYPRHSKIGCTCEVTDVSGGVIAKRTFYFFVDLKPDIPDELAEITFAGADWPRKDSRRVDYGQAIEQVTYEIANRTTDPMRVLVRTRTLWADESNSELAEVHKIELELTPFQSQLLTVPEIAVTEQVYQDVGRGKINLRCHAVAMLAGPLWNRGDRVAENTLSFFLNTDPAYGFWEETVFSQDGPARSLAQWTGRVEPGSSSSTQLIPLTSGPRATASYGRSTCSRRWRVRPSMSS